MFHIVCARRLRLDLAFFSSPRFCLSLLTASTALRKTTPDAPAVSSTTPKYYLPFKRLSSSCRWATSSTIRARKHSRTATPPPCSLPSLTVVSVLALGCLLTPNTCYCIFNNATSLPQDPSNHLAPAPAHSWPCLSLAVSLADLTLFVGSQSGIPTTPIIILTHTQALQWKQSILPGRVFRAYVPHSSTRYDIYPQYFVGRRQLILHKSLLDKPRPLSPTKSSMPSCISII